MKALSILIAIMILLCPITVYGAGTYASVQMLDQNRNPQMASTELAGHYYRVDRVTDEAEEANYYNLNMDGKKLVQIPNGKYAEIVIMGGKLYVSSMYTIYRLEGKKLVKVTELDDYIHQMTTNGKNIYVSTGESPELSWQFSGYDARFVKVSADGKQEKYGKITFLGYDVPYFAVNADGDRLAYAEHCGTGVTIQKPDGSEYEQRMKDWIKDYEDYSIDSVLYYGNCLIASVKGSLVYYDEKNNRHTILGDMKGDRWWKESYRKQPGGDDTWPVKSGTGDKVRLGYVFNWTIGSNGYVYGTTMVRWNDWRAFKLKIPESVKKTETYKKEKE